METWMEARTKILATNSQIRFEEIVLDDFLDNSKWPLGLFKYCGTVPRVMMINGQTWNRAMEAVAADFRATPNAGALSAAMSTKQGPRTFPYPPVHNKINLDASSVVVNNRVEGESVVPNGAKVNIYQPDSLVEWYRAARPLPILAVTPTTPITQSPVAHSPAQTQSQLVNQVQAVSAAQAAAPAAVARAGVAPPPTTPNTTPIQTMLWTANGAGARQVPSAGPARTTVTLTTNVHAQSVGKCPTVKLTPSVYKAE